MKAVIKLDAPDNQIGQEVIVVFPDATQIKGVCEAVKVYPKPERLLPCKCGCKRREHWWGINSDKPEILKCQRCGFEVAGKDVIDVNREWNKAVSSLCESGEEND